VSLVKQVDNDPKIVPAADAVSIYWAHVHARLNEG
jgi:hypothetical protein